METLKKAGSPYPGLLALLIRPAAFNPPLASSSSSNRLSKPLTGNNRRSMPCLPHCGADTGCSAWPPPGTGRGTGFGPCWFTQHLVVSIAPDKQRAASSEQAMLARLTPQTWSSPPHSTGVCRHRPWTPWLQLHVGDRGCSLLRARRQSRRFKQLSRNRVEMSGNEARWGFATSVGSRKQGSGTGVVPHEPPAPGSSQQPMAEPLNP